MKELVQQIIDSWVSNNEIYRFIKSGFERLEAKMSQIQAELAELRAAVDVIP